MGVLNITDFIPDGLDNAVSQKQLCDMTHMNDREVRQAIETARRQGAPICSSCHPDSSGYYMPKTKHEATIYLTMQQHRINSAIQAMKPVQDAFPYLSD
ncbi:MAG: hypothetical protein K2J71_00585 [Oscillospiraceae bacterium]|nr:hypothetical protein [Oscillospiraceae bacterium]MDE6729259.1 hypothetical protein [Oscillospiraceae bacterium]